MGGNAGAPVLEGAPTPRGRQLLEGTCVCIAGQHMDSLLADGDELELTPDPPWQWLIPVKVPVAG